MNIRPPMDVIFMYITIDFDAYIYEYKAYVYDYKAYMYDYKAYMYEHKLTLVDQCTLCHHMAP